MEKATGMNGIIAEESSERKKKEKTRAELGNNSICKTQRHGRSYSRENRKKMSSE